jgi:hypothetical protein
MGHQIESLDTTDTFHIILQNPNGLKINAAMEEFILGARICHSLGAAIISLPESNTNWNQPYQTKQLNTTIRKIWETSSTQTSQHPEPFYNRHQRGGTLQIITD